MKSVTVSVGVEELLAKGKEDPNHPSLFQHLQLNHQLRLNQHVRLHQAVLWVKEAC